MKLLSRLNYLFSHRYAPLVAFIAIAAVFAVISQHQLNTIRTTQHRLAQTQATQQNIIYGSCVRLNIALAEENISHSADYHVFTILYTLERGVEKSQHFTKHELKIENAFLSPLNVSLHEKTWTPLINCNAVSSARYHIPQPIKFTTRMPPKSALQVPPSPPSNPGGIGVHN